MQSLMFNGFCYNSIQFFITTPRMHVWYIYLHLVDVYRKCSKYTCSLDPMGYAVILILVIRECLKKSQAYLPTILAL